MDDWNPDLALYQDPDVLLDQLRDDGYDFPVPCHLCGGERAFRIVFMGDRPERAQRVCKPCYESVDVKRRLDYMEATK